MNVNTEVKTTVDVEMKVLRVDKIVPILTMQFPNEDVLNAFISWMIGGGTTEFYMYSSHDVEAIQPNPDEPFLVME